MTKATLDRARALVERQAEWLRLRDRTTGRIVGYGIPASAVGTFHLASPTRCSCKGFDRRGECSHQAACIHFVALRRAEAKEVAEVAAALLADDSVSFCQWLEMLDRSTRLESDLAGLVDGDLMAVAA